MDSWYKVIDPNNPGPDHELMAGAYGYSLTSLARRYLRDALEQEDPEAFQAALVALEDQHHKGKSVRNHYPVSGPVVNLVIPRGLLMQRSYETAYQSALYSLRRTVEEYGDDSFLGQPFQITAIETTGRGAGRKRPMIVGQFQVEDSRIKRTFDIPPSLVSPKDWTGIFNALDYSLSHTGAE